MKTDEAIEILEEHNKWRRGDEPYETGGEGMPHNPKELGLAITHAIEHMKRFQWRDIKNAPCF
jgi:hypothetical protein